MLLIIGFSTAQAAEAPDVRSLMTAEDFSAAGLDKLSDEERAQLSDWVSRYRDGAIKGPAAPRTAEQREVEEAKEDKADGLDLVANVIPRFEGWSGKTIFRLDNGQIWKQRIHSKMRYSGDDYRVIISRNLIGKYNMKHVETGRVVGVQRVQ